MSSGLPYNFFMLCVDLSNGQFVHSLGDCSKKITVISDKFTYCKLTSRLSIVLI